MDADKRLTKKVDEKDLGLSFYMSVIMIFFLLILQRTVNSDFFRNDIYEYPDWLEIAFWASFLIYPLFFAYWKWLFSREKSGNDGKERKSIDDYPKALLIAAPLTTGILSIAGIVSINGGKLISFEAARMLSTEMALFKCVLEALVFTSLFVLILFSYIINKAVAKKAEKELDKMKEESEPDTAVGKGIRNLKEKTLSRIKARSDRQTEIEKAEKEADEKADEIAEEEINELYKTEYNNGSKFYRFRKEYGRARKKQEIIFDAHMDELDKLDKQYGTGKADRYQRYNWDGRSPLGNRIEAAKEALHIINEKKPA